MFSVQLISKIHCPSFIPCRYDCYEAITFLTLLQEQRPGSVASLLLADAAAAGFFWTLTCTEAAGFCFTFCAGFFVALAGVSSAKAWAAAAASASNSFMWLVGLFFFNGKLALVAGFGGVGCMYRFISGVKDTSSTSSSSEALVAVIGGLALLQAWLQDQQLFQLAGNLSTSFHCSLPLFVLIGPQPPPMIQHGGEVGCS